MNSKSITAMNYCDRLQSDIKGILNYAQRSSKLKPCTPPGELKYQLLKKLIVLLLVCTVYFPGKSQENHNTGLQPPEFLENILFYTDRDIYFSGETVWFKARYTSGPALQQQYSNILYVEIFNNKSQAVARNKFRIADGKSTGSFTIPAETPSGFYNVKAYTQFLRNFPTHDNNQCIITVINPDFPFTQAPVLDTVYPKNRNVDSKYDVFRNIDTNSIHIKTGKDVYLPREMVQLEVFCPNKEISASIAVVKHGCDTKQLGGFLVSGIREQTDSLLGWIPESRGFTVSGTVVDQISNKPLTDMLVFASVFNTEPQLHIYKTRADGRFIFSLYEFFGQANLFIGVKPEAGKQPLVLINTDFSNETSFNQNTPIAYNKIDKQLMEEMYINYQVNAICGNKPDSIPLLPTSLPIFPEDKITIYLDDYIQLDNLEEVFNEIIPFVRIKNKKGEYGCLVLDHDMNVTYEDPLILLDNIPIFDIAELMKIPPSSIDHIDVINTTFIYGDHFLRGIILVTTRTDNFGGYKMGKGSNFIDFQGLTPVTQFNTVSFANSENTDDPRPVFKNVLYWNPELNLTARGFLTSFNASDHESAYDIIVKGIDRQGNLFYKMKTIQISRN